MRRHSISDLLNRPVVLTGSKIRLRLKCMQDAVDDYRWRRDIELCRLDAALPVSVSLEEYQKSYTEEPFCSNRVCHLAIETLDGRHIGNCSYFNIDEDKRDTEMGIMIGERDYWDQGYGTDAIRTAVDHAFSQTDLERIHLKTLYWNIRAQKCFEKCNFSPCGRLNRGEHSFILMEIHRPDKLQNEVK